MVVVKILERKRIIQLFGLALILSPLFDNYISAFLLQHPGVLWNSQIFWNMLRSRSATEICLYLFSLGIGGLMLKGSSSAWKSVLVLLGAHIANQTLHLGENYRNNPLSILFFLVNLGLFLFIADQLAWKQKKQAAQMLTTEPTAKPIVPKILPLKKTAALRAQNKMMIHFQGFGEWAQLMSISSEGIHVRCLNIPPPEIESRLIEMRMNQSLELKIRFSKREGSDIYFSYHLLTLSDLQRLNQWLQKQTAA